MTLYCCVCLCTFCFVAFVKDDGGPPNMKIKTLSLFTGTGGIELGFQDFAEPIGYCDSSQSSRNPLEKLMLKGHITTAPVYPDVCGINPASLPRGIQLATGGFPCQDASIAGKMLGLHGVRTPLFRTMLQICNDAEIPLIFLENVEGLLGPAMKAGCCWHPNPRPPAERTVPTSGGPCL